MLRTVGGHIEPGPEARPVGSKGSGQRVTHVTVRPWWDPGLAVSGFDPRSVYVERFWLGVLGPSTVLLLRRFARGLEERPNGFRVSLSDTAQAIGLGRGDGRQAPISRTIDRACDFGLARRDAVDTLSIRTHLPRLTPRQLSRLPEVVRSTHDHYLLHHAPDHPSGPRAA